MALLCLADSFVRVLLSLFNGRTFSSLDHLNETTAWWLAQVADERELREAKQTPLQWHEQERPHLVPLPAQADDVSPVVYRTVNVEDLVTYCQNGYSVPWRYIGSMLPVRITEKELIVYGREVEEIAGTRSCRARSRDNGSCTEHRPVEDAPSGGPGEVGGTVRRAGRAGPSVPGGLAAGEALRQGPGARVLALLGTYAQADLIAALEQAVPVPRVFPRGRGTHPLGPGPSQNHPGGAGRRRTAADTALAG